MTKLREKGIITEKELEEINTHYKVELHTKDMIALFFKRKFTFCFKNKYYNKLSDKDE